MRCIHFDIPSTALAFQSHGVTFNGAFTLEIPVDEAFPLFSPLGEKIWVPDWDPELLFPPGETWCPGLVFRTQEESGPALWVVHSLSMDARRVVYYRLEPELYAARIEVHCRALSENACEVSTTYGYVGLSDAGNAAIRSMTRDAYDEKMARWKKWLSALGGKK